MLEKRVDRLEGYMEQLIKTVGHNNEMTKTIAVELRQERKLNEERHQEFLSERKLSEARYQKFLSERNLNEERYQNLHLEFSEERKQNEARYQEFLSERKLNEEERKLNKERHQELLKEIRNIHAEGGYLREMVSKYDMAIHKLNASN